MRIGLLQGRSIRLRLTAWYTAVLTVTFLAMSGYVLFAVRDAARETVDGDLRARLAGVRNYIAQLGSEQDSTALADEFREQESTGAAGAWLQIADPPRGWIYRSPAAAAALPSELPVASGLPHRGRAATVTVRGRPVRVLTAVAGNRVIQIATPMDEFAEMFDTLLWTILLGSPLLLVLASAGGYWMSGRALQPVDRIGITMKRIGARNLSERLALRGTGDELDRLVTVINETLERVEAAFQMVTRFTADASHELRTPVAIVRTTAEVIGSRSRTVEEHEVAWNQVAAQTERMSGLIDDLLVLARGDAGRSGVSFEDVDLSGILAAATNEMEIMARASGVRLSQELDAEIFIHGDAEVLRRMVLALIDNAIKYTAVGGAVEVRLNLDAGAVPKVATIEVQDTGAGLASEDLPHIFDRFYRISKDRSRTTGGAGLGLSIAQWLASLHGGAISVESKVGAGSTFLVRLPVRKMA